MVFQTMSLKTWMKTLPSLVATAAEGEAVSVVMGGGRFDVET